MKSANGLKAKLYDKMLENLDLTTVHASAYGPPPVTLEEINKKMQVQRHVKQFWKAIVGRKRKK